MSEQQKQDQQHEADVREIGAYLAFGGMVWPKAGTDIGWILRYGAPSREDRLFAASIVDAYQDLITAPGTKRTDVVRKLRAAMRPASAPGSGATP